MKTLLRLFWQSATSWLDDDAARLSAALAFFTMLSLSPLLLIATSVAGVFYEQEAAQSELIQQVQGLVGSDGAEVVNEALDSARFDKETSTWSAVMAGLLLLFTSTAVFVQLQSALNKVWNTGPENIDMPVWKRLLVVRGRSLALVIGIGFLLLVSLVGDAALSLMRGTLSDIWPALDSLLQFAYTILSLFVAGGLFFLMFRYLPDTDVDTKAAWIGGFTTAILLTIGKWFIGLYLGNSAVASAYGAAGSLVVFLLWMYYSMLMFFFGAEFTHTLSKHRLSRGDNDHDSSQENSPVSPIGQGL
jgi:membrane protein